MRLEDIGVVVVNGFGGNQGCLPRINPSWKLALQNCCLIPGNWMQRKVTDARALRRKWEVLQYGKGVRQHFRPGKIGKPKAEIKGVRHSRPRIIGAALRVTIILNGPAVERKPGSVN